jgi:hypothetical protein
MATPSGWRAWAALLVLGRSCCESLDIAPPGLRKLHPPAVPAALLDRRPPARSSRRVLPLDQLPGPGHVLRGHLEYAGGYSCYRDAQLRRITGIATMVSRRFARTVSVFCGIMARAPTGRRRGSRLSRISITTNTATGVPPRTGEISSYRPGCKENGGVWPRRVGRRLSRGNPGGAGHVRGNGTVMAVAGRGRPGRLEHQDGAPGGAGLVLGPPGHHEHVSGP